MKKLIITLLAYALSIGNVSALDTERAQNNMAGCESWSTHGGNICNYAFDGSNGTQWRLYKPGGNNGFNSYTVCIEFIDSFVPTGFGLSQPQYSNWQITDFNFSCSNDTTDCIESGTWDFLANLDSISYPGDYPYDQEFTNTTEYKYCKFHNISSPHPTYSNTYWFNIYGVEAGAGGEEKGPSRADAVFFGMNF